jgi:DNA-binding MarR family transcriptional regulator
VTRPTPAHDEPTDPAHAAAQQRVIREPLPHRFTRDDYVPAPISILNGYLRWGGSRVYRLRFGLGVNEYQMLGMAANFPGHTANDAAEYMGLNKAIVSRSVASLIAKGLLAAEKENRFRRLYLTESGAELYDAIMPVALERERVLLERLGKDEIDTLHRLLDRLLEQTDALRAYDQRLTANLGEDKGKGEAASSSS